MAKREGGEYVRDRRRVKSVALSVVAGIAALGLLPAVSVASSPNVISLARAQRALSQVVRVTSEHLIKSPHTYDSRDVYYPGYHAAPDLEPLVRRQLSPNDTDTGCENVAGTFYGTKYQNPGRKCWLIYRITWIDPHGHPAGNTYCAEDWFFWLASGKVRRTNLGVWGECADPPTARSYGQVVRRMPDWLPVPVLPGHNHKPRHGSVIAPPVGLPLPPRPHHRTPGTMKAHEALLYGTWDGWYGPYDLRASYGVWELIGVTDFRAYTCGWWDDHYYSAGNRWVYWYSNSICPNASGFAGVDTTVFDTTNVFGGLSGNTS